MNTYSNFKELAKANGTAVYESNIGLNATFSSLLQANTELANTAADNSTANIAKLNTLKDDISEGLVLWNMALLDSLQGIRGCRKGLGIYINPDDHGNAHVEVKQGTGNALAKIFMYPKIALDPSRDCYLEKAELDAAVGLIKKKLIPYCEEWNRLHKDNPAAQLVPIKKMQTQK